MSRFLIWLPGVGSTDEGIGQMDRVGLQRLKAGAVFASLMSGPTDEVGLLVSWPKVGDDRPMYQPDSQSWHEAIAIDDLPRGRYWLGVEINQPPIPRQIAWKNQAPGQEVILGDGNKWIIPHVTSLQMALAHTDSGEVGTLPEKETRAYADTARRLYASIDANQTPDPQQGMRLIYESLCVNYAMTPELITALKLVNTINVGSVAEVALHGLKQESIIEMTEKFEAARLPQVPSEFAD